MNRVINSFMYQNNGLTTKYGKDRTTLTFQRLRPLAMTIGPT